jgi:hypothetical protein
MRNKFDNFGCFFQVGELMERDGVQFIHPATPLSFRKKNVQIPTELPAGAIKHSDGSVCCCVFKLLPYFSVETFMYNVCE